MRIEFQIEKKLDSFSLDVKGAFDRGVLVIRGESGAGKTTVLNCISGLLKPDEGSIKLGDHLVFESLTQINVPTRERQVGYLFQSYALFPNMTVKENILYGIKNHQDYRDKAKRKNLLEYMESVIQTFGIESLKDKYPTIISGGEKQRTALARAIVTRPRVLLLDEPFSALDTETKKIVYDEFFAFKEKFDIPTIMITHNVLESKMFADYSMIIHQGKIIASFEKAISAD